VFASTYDQHLKNVARWREYQKEQATAAAQSAPPGEAAPATNGTAQKSATPTPPPAPNRAPADKGSKRTGQTSDKGKSTQ
jgi:UPF0755 protein